MYFKYVLLNVSSAKSKCDSGLQIVLCQTAACQHFDPVNGEIDLFT